MDNNKKNGFEWFASGNASALFPTELITGGFLFEDLTKVDIPESSPFATVWGKPVSMHLLPDNHHPAPKFIFIIWFSIVESKFYAVSEELPTAQIEALLAEKNEKTKEPKYNTIIAGMAPHGKLAIWLSGNGITTQVAWLQGKEAPAEMQDFAPNSKLSKREYAQQRLAECAEAQQNLTKNGLPNPALYEQYMQQFNYKITPQFENVQFENIELYYYNGELNTNNSGGYAENTMRAKPSKIVLHWSTGKTKYSGYFWTDEKKIIDAFQNCYGDDTQKKAEFIIQEENSYKQFRFFLKNSDASIEIPADDMQYVIFKNKFEFCRSENYNKPKGGWRD